MTDSKYFTIKKKKKKKGEIFELKAELNNERKEKKQEAKLVFLYLRNYAMSQPDMAIMAVNSFVDRITEHLCEPLCKCLKDEDTYVRKTAAVCVTKLHGINAQEVEDQGFLDSLWDFIADSNPMVVANALAILSEISESHPSSNLFDLNPQNINKLLTALNKYTEWGQTFISDCLSNYNSKDDWKTHCICECFLELLLKDLDYYNMLLKKLAPPLVTLLSGEPEVQYIALRSINKLDIMIHLAFQEYATGVDVDFVRKAVWAVGWCAFNTKVNCVVQEVTAIRDIFHKHSNKYETVMIWIVGEYFERTDNAEELWENFLEGFSEKPLMSEETDLFEPTLLGELICHTGSLTSQGFSGRHTDAHDSPVGTTTATNLEQPQVIASQGDLLRVNLPQVSSMQMGAVDLLGGGLDSLVGQFFIPSSVPATFAPSPIPAVVKGGLNELSELSMGIGMAPGGCVAPKATSGTFTHRKGHIYMEMNLSNKALQHMTNCAILFHKNSGCKNNIDVFYFSCLIQLNVFLATWKDIPYENELQFQIKKCHLNADTVSNKLQNNVYTIAKRNVEGQDMMYQSLKLINGIWILSELHRQPGNPNYMLSLKCRAPEVSQYIYQVYNGILKNE
ncbi:unnamed protein product [Nyctereutes procyonoides]|uniref:(raccoon dog) hypothetical protein n=1 Tax=Nyctereutes procyonoides TaxID=34880 RepID=A0A811YSN1_NYCPR|nr:unnamed protein product [Nyctereutes procyonoides]